MKDESVFALLSKVNGLLNSTCHFHGVFLVLPYYLPETESDFKSLGLCILVSLMNLLGIRNKDTSNLLLVQCERRKCTLTKPCRNMKVLASHFLLPLTWFVS